MRRCELLQVFRGALAWPLAARAEQPGAVIGLLHAASASVFCATRPVIFSWELGSGALTHGKVLRR